MKNAKVYQGFHDDKKLKSTVVEAANMFMPVREDNRRWGKRVYGKFLCLTFTWKECVN